MTTAVQPRDCRACGKTLARRGTEKASAFNRRSHCDHTCAKDAQRQARQRPTQRGPSGPYMPPRLLPGYGWMARASCRDEDPELFFSDHHSMPDKARVDEARSVCRWCPVRGECLAYALATDAYGVWAATTRDERDSMRKASA